MLARCPSCSERFGVVGSARMPCPFCGAEVEVRVQRARERAPVAVARAVGGPAAGSGQAPEVVADLPDDAPSPSPRAARELAALLGAGAPGGRARAPAPPPGRALLDALGGALGAPERFFHRLGAGGGGRAVAFALAVVLPGALVHAVGVYHVLGRLGWAGVAARPPLAALAAGAGVAALALVACLVVGAALAAHALGGRPGARVALRLAAFSLAPMVLGVIPLVGPVAGALGSIVTLRAGLLARGGLGRSTSWCAALLPWAVLLAAAIHRAAGA
jgi:hypothetical protein